MSNTQTIPYAGEARHDYLLARMKDNGGYRVKGGDLNLTGNGYTYDGGWINLRSFDDQIADGVGLSFQTGEFDDAEPLGNDRWRLFAHDGAPYVLSFPEAAVAA